MTKITTSSFQKGIFIEHRGEIHQISEFQHVNPGKGSAFIRTKLKNIKTGNTVEFTYKSGEEVEKIPIHIKEMQYLYKNNNQYFFMDPESFEQRRLSDQIIGSLAKFLKEGNSYQVYVNEDDAIGIKSPKKIKLKVTQANEAVKGNTVTGAKKPVTVETGVTVQVPLFIKRGDIVAINPETGQYLERVNQ